MGLAETLKNFPKSPMRPTGSYHWQAGGGGRKTRGPSVFFRRRRLATELGFATCRWAACGKAKLSGKSLLLFERKVNLGLVHNLNLNMKA